MNPFYNYPKCPTTGLGLLSGKGLGWPHAGLVRVGDSVVTDLEYVVSSPLFILLVLKEPT